jgi:hypothetical protein
MHLTFSYLNRHGPRGIVFIGLVAHRRECAFDLPRFHADDVEACCL